MEGSKPWRLNANCNRGDGWRNHDMDGTWGCGTRFASGPLRTAGGTRKDSRSDVSRSRFQRINTSFMQLTTVVQVLENAVLCPGGEAGWMRGWFVIVEVSCPSFHGVIELRVKMIWDGRKARASTRCPDKHFHMRHFRLGRIHRCGKRPSKTVKMEVGTLCSPSSMGAGEPHTSMRPGQVEGWAVWGMGQQRGGREGKLHVT